jgi:hypothetical protein
VVTITKSTVDASYRVRPGLSFMGITSQIAGFTCPLIETTHQIEGEAIMLNQIFDNVYPTKSRAFLDGLLTGIALALIAKTIYDAGKPLEYMDENGEPVDVVESTCCTKTDPTD